MISGESLLVGVTWLLVFQCVGEGAARVFDPPVPGPVVGMLAPSSRCCSAKSARIARYPPTDWPGTCRCCSSCRRWRDAPLRASPTTVPIVVALLVSTIFTIAAAGWTFGVATMGAEGRRSHARGRSMNDDLIFRLGLPFGHAAGGADRDAGGLLRRVLTTCARLHPFATRPDLRAPHRGAARGHAHEIRDVLRRRAVRPFSARPPSSASRCPCPANGQTSGGSHCRLARC